MLTTDKDSDGFKLKKRRSFIDLGAHHATCEINYHRLLLLMPGFERNVSNESYPQWHLDVAADDMAWSLHVDLKVIDMAPYTTTVEIIQDSTPPSQLATTPRLVVRLYHDVSMAEIISWDHHRHWQPRYEYPNPQMYQPDEKLSLSRFLCDWLVFCCSRAVFSAER